MRQEELARLVDEFGRTSDANFQINELLGFLDDRAGQRVDDNEVMKLAGSSPYLFESWNDPMTTQYVPRRRFFQGATFLITPTAEEVSRGRLFPGHRFGPYLCRDVFPADAWLVMADGSAPKVKRVDMALPSARNALRLFGAAQAREYLIADEPANAKAVEKVSVSTFDLRDFYLATEFKPGDSLLVKTLDWLQGVFSISKMNADIEPASAVAWSNAMTAAHARMQAELGTKADCYEQCAIMHLLGVEDRRLQLDAPPPMSLEAFIESRGEIELAEEGDRAVLRSKAPRGGASATALDAVLKEMGLSMGEVVAAMRGARDPDIVLATVSAGRPLLFKSPAAQDEFHRQWLELWRKVVDSGSAER